jgi:integrase/recombinase XerC
VRPSGESAPWIVARLGGAAKVGRAVRPHGLRHAAITTALDAGKDVRVVRRFSRHRTLDMVLRYDDDRGGIAGEIAGLLARRRDEE